MRNIHVLVWVDLAFRAAVASAYILMAANSGLSQQNHCVLRASSVMKQLLCCNIITRMVISIIERVKNERMNTPLVAKIWVRI